MFPIDAIKQAQVFALLADDFFAHLDMLLEKTAYHGLGNRIALELIYYRLQHTSLVPELNISYLDLCLRLIQLINSELGILLFESEDELHCIIRPLLEELDILFTCVSLNQWGTYLVQINGDYIEISYVGDYRILQWSKTDEADKLRQNIATQQLYVEQTHSFKQR